MAREYQHEKYTFVYVTPTILAHITWSNFNVYFIQLIHKQNKFSDYFFHLNKWPVFYTNISACGFHTTNDLVSTRRSVSMSHFTFEWTQIYMYTWKGRWALSSPVAVECFCRDPASLGLRTHLCVSLPVRTWSSWRPPPPSSRWSCTVNNKNIRLITTSSYQ